MAKFRQIRSHRHLRLRMFGQKRYLRLCTKKPSKWAWTDWNVNYSADSLYTNSKEMASCGKFHSKDDLKNDWIGFWKTKTKLLLLVECSTLSFWILTSHTRDRPFNETYHLLFLFSLLEEKPFTNRRWRLLHVITFKWPTLKSSNRISLRWFQNEDHLQSLNYFKQHSL